MGEGAAQDDGRAEESEVGFADVDAVDLLGVVAGEVEAGTAEVVGRDVLKDAGLRLPVVEVGRRGGGAVAFRRCEQELDDAVGVRIGERLEEDGVDDGEDGGVGSDAEGQGGDGCDGEARVLEEAAQGVFEVMPQVGHWRFLSCSEFCLLRQGGTCIRSLLAKKMYRTVLKVLERVKEAIVVWSRWRC